MSTNKNVINQLAQLFFSGAPPCPLFLGSTSLDDPTRGFALTIFTKPWAKAFVDTAG